MPSSPNYKRDYPQERKSQIARGEQRDGKTGKGGDGNKLRKKARRQAKAAGVDVAGKDVHHKKPIKKGGTNTSSNLVAVSPSKNRSFPRNSKAGLRRG